MYHFAKYHQKFFPAKRYILPLHVWQHGGQILTSPTENCLPNGFSRVHRCSTRRESCKFFSEQSVSRFRTSRTWRGQTLAQGSSTRLIFSSSACVSSAAVTLTISGSPGTQAYASAKTPPGPMLLRTLLLPHTSPISMMTRPESTTPSCSVGVPSGRMTAPFL